MDETSELPYSLAVASVCSLKPAVSLTSVVKAMVFVTDTVECDGINKVSNEYMNDPYRARSAVEVANLPVDSGVEIDSIAPREL
ncbi:RidA family protein [Haladaptatus pallidirubidus]|uniref:Uncharacterized protein n=1 Tax=Haladaptatus pallidirubidus TaxID=1008152 RepID=A0AAV3UI30_9EURY|nr:Rid family hydrolase [Haladaptatus pallidirubidus]